MKTPDYMNYSRYKKTKKKDKKKGTLLFVTTFFATMLVFVGLAKIFSPNVDINIGNDTDYEAKDTGLGVKKFIDNRLKMIQNDDNGDAVSADGTSSSDKKISKRQKDYNDASFDSYSTEMDERVNLPKSKKKNTYYTDPDADLDSSFDEPVSTPAVRTHRPPKQPAARNLSTPIESPRMSKVYVGYYSNAQQAKVAQGILQDSGLGISPSVRSTGAGYTLQVGTYSSRSRADGVASELQRNNFPARVVQE